VTQPLPQTDRDDSRFLVETIGEQIRVGERLLDNTIKIVVETFGVTGCLLLDSDLDTEKILCRSSFDCQGIPCVDSLRALCHHYRKPLAEGETIALTHENSPLLSSPGFPLDAVTLVPLQLQPCLLGVLCLYDRTPREHPSLTIPSAAIEPLAHQCSLLLQQSRQLALLERQYLEKQPLQENLPEKINDYLAHVTHELRAPLAGILGFARMLQEQIYGTLTDKQHQYIGAIASSGEHLLSLVNDFQDLSKIEANFEEIFPEKLVVEDVCLASLSIVQAKAEQQGLALNLQISPDIDYCNADQQRLKQILVNLLSNAVKFTEIGSVTLQVEREENRLLFSVIDTGIGISSEEQQKLFQPFQQIHSVLSKKHKGTGLGLALSRKLARLHGGDITILSEKGKGSSFILTIPHS
jgi:signal transduction histidine kinase